MCNLFFFYIHQTFTLKLVFLKNTSVIIFLMDLSTVYYCLRQKFRMFSTVLRRGIFLLSQTGFVVKDHLATRHNHVRGPNFWCYRKRFRSLGLVATPRSCTHDFSADRAPDRQHTPNRMEIFDRHNIIIIKRIIRAIL